MNMVTKLVKFNVIPRAQGMMSVEIQDVDDVQQEAMVPINIVVLEPRSC